MFKLRDYQQKVKSGVLAAWGRVRAVLAIVPTGGGKCLGKGTPVLMYDGTIKKVEDVKQGDLLMGPDSKPRTVLSTCKGVEQLYTVTPVKGDPYVINESHILSLKETGTDRVVNVGVLDYLAASKNFRHMHKGWRAGVRYRSQKLDEKMPPYLLGLWLGGGSSRGPSIATEDRETVRYMREFCELNGYPLRAETISSTNNAKTYFIGGNGRHTGTFMSALRKNDLILNKHIPHKYKTASRADRLELLAGLVDSDGHLRHNGYDFVFKSKRLAEDAVFVARSLGFSAYLKECQKTCTNTGTYWRFAICGGVSEVPVKVPRKKAAPRKQKKNVLLTGLTVKPAEVGGYYGFEIDGDRLFMLGDFTVTHNTVIFSSLMHDHQGASAAVAHRKEIVTQISLSLAKLGVYHRVIAPDKTIRTIRRKHLKQLGKSFVDVNAKCGVISVQTLTSKSSAKDAALQRWIKQLTLCVFDEGHHYVTTGLWANAVDMMDRAKLLFVSATPGRADGIGLGAHAGGYIEEVVQGPSTAWLISQKFLSRYIYKAPKTDLDMRDIALTKSGDFNAVALRARVVDSHLVGDVVQHYIQHGENKKAIVFATDVATAEEVAAEFVANGFKAVALSGATDSGVRDRALERFEDGDLQILVNVDLFDEGFDVPAVECVILARPTQSLAKFLQMVGRALRVMRGKEYAIIIDPVRNWERHGTPTLERVWSMDNKEKGEAGGGTDTIPQRVCDGCSSPYEAFYLSCPYCGTTPSPAVRKLPGHVDGDLLELDVEAIDALFKIKDDANMTVEDFERHQLARNVHPLGRAQELKRHKAAKYRRGALEQLVGWWVGVQEHAGREMAEIHKRFYLRFGVDIITAFSLNEKDTDKLIKLIEKRFTSDLV